VLENDVETLSADGIGLKEIGIQLSAILDCLFVYSFIYIFTFIHVRTYIETMFNYQYNFVVILLSRWLVLTSRYWACLYKSVSQALYISHLVELCLHVQLPTSGKGYEYFLSSSYSDGVTDVGEVTPRAPNMPSRCTYKPGVSIFSDSPHRHLTRFAKQRAYNKKQC